MRNGWRFNPRKWQIHRENQVNFPLNWDWINNYLMICIKMKVMESFRSYAGREGVETVDVKEGAFRSRWDLDKPLGMSLCFLAESISQLHLASFPRVCKTTWRTPSMLLPTWTLCHLMLDNQRWNQNLKNILIPKQSYLGHIVDCAQEKGYTQDHQLLVIV